MSLTSRVVCGSEVFDKLGSQFTRIRKYVGRQNTGLLFFFHQYLQRQKKESHIICTQYVNNGLNTKLGFPRFYSFFHSLMVLYFAGTLNLAILGR